MGKPILTNDDFCRAAKRLKCQVAAIKAVANTESAGKGFYDDGFPVILYERHLFRKFTQGRYNSQFPELSGPQGNYGATGQNQRRKFAAAFALNPDAAMKACSWGKFQILGSNHKVCGYATPGAFVDAIKESEGKHLDAFVGFVIGNHLDGHLRNLNWAAFARGYNGPAYRKNNYDVKMANAFAKFSKENIDCSNLSTAAVSAPGLKENVSELESSNDNTPTLPDGQPDTPEANTPPPIVPDAQTQPSVTNTTVEEKVIESTPEGETTTTTTAQSIAAPIEVKKETPSWMVKIAAPFTALAGLGINAGSFIQTKLEEMTVQQIVYMVVALGLVGVAIYWWQKAAKAAQARTLALVETAADPKKTTVTLTK